MSIAATTSVQAAATRTWDAVVVGAGPAGAMAAHELARRGLAVLLVDRAAFPRWKVCGCCLNRHALAALRGAGLEQLVDRDGAVPLERLHLAAAGRSAGVPLAGGVSLSRERFDAALVSAAVEAGAAFLPQTRASLSAPVIEGESRTVELRQEHGTECVSARVILAADGLGGQLAARAGAGEVATAAGARIGAGAVAVEAPAFYKPGVIYMACGRHGYLGLVRLEDGRLDLAAAFDAAGVRACGGPAGAAAALLAEAGWPAVSALGGHAWRGTPALTRRARRVAAERLFLLGDAAGYVEPFTGEGMAWALTAARAVAPLAERAARDWRPGLVAQWATTYRRLLARRQLVCRAVAAVLRSPPLIRTTIRLLSLAPILAAPVTRYLGAARAAPAG